MYLTRMRLNPTRVTTKRMLSSPQVAHALVEGSFPPRSQGAGRNLWRIDRRGPELDLFVASPERPDLTGVIEQAGWPTHDTWQTQEYAPFLSRLEPGQRWRFRLTANPTRSQPREPGTRGKVRPLRTIAQQGDWLVEMSTRHGFVIPSTSAGAAEFAVVRRGESGFVRVSERDGRERRDHVELTRVTYEGVLEIVDADVVRKALTAGIGRAKGYGCGLMTLARWP